MVLSTHGGISTAMQSAPIPAGPLQIDPFDAEDRYPNSVGLFGGVSLKGSYLAPTMIGTRSTTAKGFDARQARCCR
jgi:hypothetical protein